MARKKHWYDYKIVHKQITRNEFNFSVEDAMDKAKAAPNEVIQPTDTIDKAEELYQEVTQFRLHQGKGKSH